MEFSQNQWVQLHPLHLSKASAASKYVTGCNQIKQIASFHHTAFLVNITECLKLAKISNPVNRPLQGEQVYVFVFVFFCFVTEVPHKCVSTGSSVEAMSIPFNMSASRGWKSEAGINSFYLDTPRN